MLGKYELLFDILLYCVDISETRYPIYPVEGNDTHMNIQILCKTPKP